MKKLISVVAMLSALAFPNIAPGYFYPDDGSLYYDGRVLAESYFKWNSTPGPWQNADPGYEHDFAVRPEYFNACASFTNMPYPYDDCPTAGFKETGYLWFFSFGTYHANALTAGVWYYGKWNFARPSGAWSMSEFGLWGNETYHQQTFGCYNYDNPWCMEGARWKALISGMWLNYGGTPTTVVW